MSVEGVIELTNSSGKDISLTQYDMNLPHFTLKNTKIDSIYPKAFLVDMYSQNNSILFTFKSQFTKPVVMGKGAKIIFTFSALVEKPYKDVGGLRTLFFPFTLTEEGRNVRITVSVNQDLPLISAPQVAKTLQEKRIFTVNAETGKVFLFSKSEAPFAVTFAHSAEVFLPPFNTTHNCFSFQPISCIGCGDILTNTLTEGIRAQRSKDSKMVAFQFAKIIESRCAQDLSKNLSAPSESGRTFQAGYIIAPLSNQLIPATWRVNISEKGRFATSYIANGVPYFYADPYGYLTIPLFSCASDDDCRAKSERLQTLDTTLSSELLDTIPGITEISEGNLSYSITQQGREFTLLLKNNAAQYFHLSALELPSNPYFSLSTIAERLIPPKSTLEVQLETKSTVQFSNLTADIRLLVNGHESKVQFKPITITILAIIEILAYVFIVSIGITLVSMLGIILYTRYYEKKK